MSFLPIPKTDPDYGRGISPYDNDSDDIIPVKCYWCDEVIDDEPTMYKGKPHHHVCACENQADDRRHSHEA